MLSSPYIYDLNKGSTKTCLLQHYIWNAILEAEKIDFFKQMAETFFDAYRVIIENNKDLSFDQKDIDYKYMLHGQWAQWILVEDEGTRFGLDMGIHPDALLGPILPPVAKF